METVGAIILSRRILTMELLIIEKRTVAGSSSRFLHTYIYIVLNRYYILEYVRRKRVREANKILLLQIIIIQ